MTTVEECIETLQENGLLERLKSVTWDGLGNTTHFDLYPPGGAGRSSSVDELQPTTSDDPLAELKSLLPNATFPRELT